MTCRSKIPKEYTSDFTPSFPVTEDMRSVLGLLELTNDISVEANGAGREAFLIVETFPFDTPYTVQKSDIANQSSELRRIYKILLVF
ncbi:hypothetical protein NC652_031020 [Populus alba x Populus x berolinensis]|nr:hypothetical protein NC652_031020 [Populus alba x Populus x berolinensis]